VGWISKQLAKVSKKPIDDLLEARYRRFRRLGEFVEAPQPPPAPPAESVQSDEH
jgi:hypothetical protein